MFIRYLVTGMVAHSRMVKAPRHDHFASEKPMLWDGSTVLAFLGGVTKLTLINVGSTDPFLSTQLHPLRGDRSPYPVAPPLDDAAASRAWPSICTSATLPGH